MLQKQELMMNLLLNGIVFGMRLVIIYIQFTNLARTYALTNSICCFHDNYHIVMKIWPLTEFTKMAQK